MAITQTYESHIVARTLSGIAAWDADGGGVESAAPMPLVQGEAHVITFDYKRERYLGKQKYQYNMAQDSAKVSINLNQLDYYGDSLWAPGLFRTGSYSFNGTQKCLFNQIITGGDVVDGAPIFFGTEVDTKPGEFLGRTQSGRFKQEVFYPSYLEGVGWSVSANSVAQFNFKYSADIYEDTAHLVDISEYTFIHRIHPNDQTTSGLSYTTITQADIDSYLDGSAGTQSNEGAISGIFFGGLTTVSGEINLGPVRSIAWDVDITRRAVQGVGDFMPKRRVVDAPFIGKLTLEHNYDGGDPTGYLTSNLWRIGIPENDFQNDITINAQDSIGNQRTFEIENAKLENINYNGAVGAGPDTLTAEYSFIVDKSNGLLVTYYDV
jgi:hypothetical protein